jgi:hypothetical protein
MVEYHNLKKLPLIALTSLAFFSVYKTLWFYFWHDDFSVLYVPRVGECIFKWPYQSYCTIFVNLDKLFNYSAVLYFLLGVVLFVFCVLQFYKLCQYFLPKSSSFLTGAIFATGFIGSGVFLESYSSITTFASLGMFLFSLNFLVKKSFISFILSFIVSILVLQARSISYIVPPIFLILAEGKFKKSKIAKIAIVIIAFLIAYQLPLSDSSGVMQLLAETNYMLEIEDFLATFGKVIAFFLSTTDLGTYKFVALVFFSLVAASAFRKLLQKGSIKLELFSLVWICVMYGPYGLRSDGAMEATHRYLVFVMPGIVLLWSTFARYKLWKVVSILWTIVAFLSIQQYLAPHLKASSERREFYSRLHSFIPNLKKDSVLYFDFSQLNVSAADFLRVGFTPSESAIGTEYKMNYKDISLLTDSSQMRHYLASNELKTDNFYSFYYGGQGLIDTTDLSKSIINGGVKQQKVNVVTKSEFIFDESKSKWTGSTKDLQSKVTFAAPVPMKLRIDLQAKLLKVSYPYSHFCTNCIQFDNSVRESLNYLAESRKIKEIASVVTTQSGEDTLSEYLIDKNNATYWLANRQLWFRNEVEKATIKVQFNQSISLDGFWFTTDTNKRSPVEFELISKGQKLEYQVVKESELTKVVFATRNTNNLTIKILKTESGDSPKINELFFIPQGFAQADFKTANLLRENPAAYIGSDVGYSYLLDYVSTGTQACVKWQAGDENGEVPFLLNIDGKLHSYELDLPSSGTEKMSISIGCLNYPVEVNLSKVSTYFSGNDKH